MWWWANVLTGGGCQTAQSPGQLKVRFFVVLYNNFATCLHHQIMSSTYQVTQNCISDAINTLHNGDYSNPTAAARAFGVNPKTVQQRLRGGASKSSRLPTNKALNLEQEQALRDYIKRLDEQNVSAKISMIRAAANYILKSLILIPSQHLLRSAKNGPNGFLIAIHNSIKKKTKAACSRSQKCSQ